MKSVLKLILSVHVVSNVTYTLRAIYRVRDAGIEIVPLRRTAGLLCLITVLTVTHT